MIKFRKKKVSEYTLMSINEINERMGNKLSTKYLCFACSIVYSSSDYVYISINFYHKTIKTFCPNTRGLFNTVCEDRLSFISEDDFNIEYIKK